MFYIHYSPHVKNSEIYYSLNLFSNMIVVFYLPLCLFNLPLLLNGYKFLQQQLNGRKGWGWFQRRGGDYCLRGCGFGGWLRRR